MKNILKIEELAMFTFSLYLFNQLPYAWWVFPVLLLTPDIGVLGYLVNPRMGAWMYTITKVWQFWWARLVCTLAFPS